MTGIEREVRARLRELAHDLPDDDPPRDAVEYVRIARSLHQRRRARRTAWTIALLLLAVICIPVTFRLLTPAGPGAGRAAATPPASASAARQPLDDPAVRARAAAELRARFGTTGASTGFIQECLAGSGLATYVWPDGSFEIQRRPGHEDADAALLSDCEDRLGIATPLSADASQLLIADWTGTWSCLTAHGWPAMRPPRGMTVNSGLLDWNPYEGVPVDALAQARATCPVRTY